MAVGDRTEKRLAGPTQLGNTTTTIGTVPSSRNWVIKQIIITNNDTIDRTLSLAIGTAATEANRLMSTLPIGANDIMVFDTALVLTAAETLEGLADTASKVNVTLVGWEKEV
jgi:hypothetical protein